MKKLLAISAITIMALAGCTNNVEETNKSRNSIFTVVEKASDYDYIVKDTTTGCYYIQSLASYGYYVYTPYVGEDSKVIGCGQKDFKY